MEKMELNKWCKVIQIGDHQILVNKEGWNEEDESYGVKISAFVKGAMLSMTASDEDEVKINTLFDEYDESMAEVFLNQTVLTFFEDNL